MKIFTDSLTLITILVIIGLVGVTTFETILYSQHAQGLGCQGSGIAFNASKGRCFRA